MSELGCHVALICVWTEKLTRRFFIDLYCVFKPWRYSNVRTSLYFLVSALTQMSLKPSEYFKITKNNSILFLFVCLFIKLTSFQWF